MDDKERIEAILKIIATLTPTTPPDDWYPKFNDVTDHLAHLPVPLAARYLAKVAKKFGVPKKDVSDEVKKKRQQLAAALAPPPAYAPDAHPAIGCTNGGEFWIATAGPHPEAPWSATWIGFTASGEERIGPLEPVILHGVAAMFEGRWSEESREEFPGSVDLPDLPAVYEQVRRLVSKYIEFPREHGAAFTAAVSLWVIGTYLHPLFGVFAYLTIEGPKGSGKSRLLDLLSALCFNGFLSPSVTAAVLCRIVAGARATVCFDEVEHLHQNSEDTATLRALINAGYKQGGQVPRVSREGGVDLFDAFSPKAFAGISGLNDVTADRAIRIIMVRATDPQKCRLSIDPKSEEIIKARDALYEVALATSERVRAAYAAGVLPKGLTNRSNELWRPLFAIASTIDASAGGDLFSIVTPMAVEDSKERSELDPISTAVADALWFRANAESKQAQKIRPGAVADDAGSITRRQIKPEWVGHFLRRLGIKKAGRDGDGAYYFMEPLKLQAQLERIGWRAPDDIQGLRRSPPSPPTSSGVGTTNGVLPGFVDTAGSVRDDGSDGSRGVQHGKPRDGGESAPVPVPPASGARLSGTKDPEDVPF